MGSNSGQDCERPIHRVWVDAFLMAATQVTNAEYALFLQVAKSDPPPFWQDQNFNDPQQPVTGVSWFDSDRYCQWLAEQTGRANRLPTEAEWERAARGHLEQNDFPWGNDLPQSLPNYAKRWQTGPEPGSPLRPQHVRSLQYVRQRSRVVQRLVRSQLLRRLARTKSARPSASLRNKPAQSLPRRIMAPSRKSLPLLRPLQHPSRLPLRRLRLPRRRRHVAPASRRLSRERPARALYNLSFRFIDLSFRTARKRGEEPAVCF